MIMKFISLPLSQRAADDELFDSEDLPLPPGIEPKPDLTPTQESIWELLDRPLAKQ